MRIRDGALSSDHQQQLQQVGHVVIDDVLEPADADALSNRLDVIDQWDFAFNTAEGPCCLDAQRIAAQTPAQRQAMMAELSRQAQQGFSMAYQRRDVVPGPPADAPLADWLNGPELVDFIKTLSGDPTLVRVDGHLSQYTAGSYLSPHDDTYVGKQRRFAYVLGLTREWRADWGGLLHFVNEDGHITATRIPGYNTLTVFSVPQMHFVSQVASYAPARRLTVTGWAFAQDR